MKRRLLCLSLILVLILTSIPVFGDMTTTGVDQNIDTDGSRRSATWFDVFDAFLEGESPKKVYGAQFYSCLDSLRKNNGDVLKDDVNIVWEALSDSEESILMNYGLSSAKVHDIMMYYLNTFPADMGVVLDSGYIYGTNIYADIYHDETLEYTQYMVRFFEYLNRQYDNLPEGMKAPVRTWDVANAGEIHQFQALLNNIIVSENVYRDNLFYEVYNTDQDRPVSRQARIQENLRSVLEAELEHIATNGGTQSLTTQVESDIQDYIGMFMILGNVILESAQKNLIDSGNYEIAMGLADKIGLYRRRNVNDPDDPEPSIIVTPESDTIYLNPNEGLGETDETQLTATVFNSNSKPEWSLGPDAEGKILVDQNGNVTIDPDFVFADDEQIATVIASIPGASDTATIFIVSNTAAGAIQFFGPYISGYPDGTFKEDNFITRAEIATMFARVLRLDVIDVEAAPVEYYTQEDFTQESFKDVPTTHWAHMYIELLKESGIISGTGDGSFKPDDPISRAEMATIISNSWDLLGIEVSDLATHEIKDVDDTHWAYDAIKKVYNGNIVVGNEDGTFGPEVKSSRLEVVKMINRVIGREDYMLPDGSFSDIPFDHEYYGTVESATRLQEVKEEVE